MMSETMKGIEHKSDSFTLRYAKKDVQTQSIDIGYACRVGDKAIRIFPNNMVEIADLEYIRAEEVEGPGAGHHPVAYTERLSWMTRYPEDLDLDAVKASLDFAFMSSGLPSLFYMTNLSLTEFDSIDDERVASIKAFHMLYPGVTPRLTELNAILFLYGQDLYTANRLQDEF